MQAPPDQIDDDENWVGGHYELALELGPRDDSRLDQAYKALIELTGFEGSWALTSLEPRRYGPIPTSYESLTSFPLMRGRLYLPSGRRVVCGLNVVREEAEPPFYAPDWLVLDIPLGALTKVEARVGGYPFGETIASLEWRRPLDDWLADIGRQIFRRVKFRLGLVGMEVSGDASSDRLESGIPADRPFGYLWPTDGELDYFPATA